MGIFDDAVPGGNISKPLMIALGALLVGKMFAGNSSAAENKPEVSEQPHQDGGLLGGLGGLLEKLTNAGHSETVDSWLKPGENKSIDPGHLESAVGSKTISDLARQAGVPEQELLEQLSKALPGLIDKLTPDGQVPTQQQIASLLGPSTPA
ncbi:YidB family protein [Rhizobium sp. SYY.PMSO]|uniref:YidB family protein n=1 Tax=Rhizobium sp. SYY.PMSO TaxID=3382192 RepID=UPI00399016FD